MAGAKKSKYQQTLAMLEHEDEIFREEACFALGESGNPDFIKPLMGRLLDVEPYVRQAAIVALGKLKAKQAVEQIIHNLDDSKPGIKKAACRTLAKLGEIKSANEIRQLVKNSDNSVKEAAINALGELKDKESIMIITQNLRDENHQIRSAACKALGEIGDKDSANSLLTLLDDPEEAVRNSSAVALGKLKNRAAVNPLIKSLWDGSQKVRISSCTALGNIGDKKAVNHLVTRLGESSNKARNAAGAALVKLGMDELAGAYLGTLSGNQDSLIKLIELNSEGKFNFIPLLTNCLKDPDPNYRKNALLALGKLGDINSIPDIIYFIHDENLNVRSAACVALGDLGESAVTNHLVSALEDGGSLVRESAAIAMGKLDNNNSKINSTLINILGDPSPEVRIAAAQSLGKHGEQELADAFTKALTGNMEAIYTLKRLSESGDNRFLPSMINCLKNPSTEISKFACITLGKIGHPDSIIPLVDCLGSENPDIADSAVDALVETGEESVEPVIESLNSPDFHVRENAAIALGKLKDKRALEPLLKAINDPIPGVCKACCFALGELGEPKAFEPLIKRLDDYSEIKAAACNALGSLGDHRAIPFLIDQLGDFDPNVRNAAAYALGNLEEKRFADAFMGTLSGDEGSREDLISIASNGDLRMIDPLKKLADKRSLGERVISVLNDISIQSESIKDNIICRKDLTRFTIKIIKTKFRDQYNCICCRKCGNASDAVNNITKIVAAMDETMEDDIEIRDGIIRVNQLKRKELCDFDEVRIAKADDFDVQSFCIKVRNDLDDYHVGRYREIKCFIKKNSKLEINTIRNLEETFSVSIEE